MNDKLAIQFLFAKFLRAAQMNFRVNWDRVELSPNISLGKGERLGGFSGHFRHEKGLLLPFNLCFKQKDGLAVTTLNMFASTVHESHSTKIHQLLALFDYLLWRGFLTEAEANRSIKEITSSGLYANRVAAVNDYADFCRRAAQDMPHDLTRVAIDSMNVPELAA